MMKLLKENKYITANEIKISLEKNNLNVSKNTIINILHELQISYKEPNNKPLLTQKQITNRIIWCNKHIDYNWDIVQFSDETSFWIGLSGKRWINIIDNNDCNYVIKHPLKINVWGQFLKHLTEKYFYLQKI